LVILSFLILSTKGVFGQCAYGDDVLSPRVANYDISVKLDTARKSVSGQQRVEFINPSPDTIRELRWYMYHNAFSNNRTTFLKESEGQVFGQSFLERDSLDWGYIEMEQIREECEERIDETFYLENEWSDSLDRTVLIYPLKNPLLPGDTVVVECDFISKLPRLIVRSGFSRDHFYHFVHWFPQLGVYEQDTSGQWGWNCHPFHRRTEFFAHFGNYNVDITFPENLIVEGSGCRSEEEAERGWKKYRFDARDVIDFAWVAYPHFDVFEDNLNGVDIRLVTAREHSCLAPRFMKALKFAMSYLEEHIAPYPYPVITVMDPPFHALRSGLMEYPMYITQGSFRYFPESVRTIESLVVHEFAHQYFMAIVASNEKEEAWLDEGFVTYYEDRIMEALFGKSSSLINVAFTRVSNSALTRSEYTGIPDREVSPVALPGWEIKESFKGLIYSKTATVLKSLEGIIGEEVFDRVIKDYYSKWSFGHPKGRDLEAVFVNGLKGVDLPEGFDVSDYFAQMIHGAEVCDYLVDEVVNVPVQNEVGWFVSEGLRRFVPFSRSTGKFGRVVLRRKGGVVVPVEVEIEFKDGSRESILWSGKERLKIMEFDKEVQACVLDPGRKLWIDVDLTNNAKESERAGNPRPLLNASGRITIWIQNILQSFSFLI
jgi:hypothetical protein